MEIEHEKKSEQTAVQDYFDAMIRSIQSLPFFISVPILAFITAFCRPNSDGKGTVGWRRFNQATFCSIISLGGLWVCEALKLDVKLALVSSIYIGLMGWEYIQGLMKVIGSSIIEKLTSKK